ncbi:MAG: metal-dependent hydrolase [Deltaproteobacteria bacterium RBG_13_53_10]|nr:MAG: metal-dependent hydrolase [Deltaproteobacteria bacterium RBG_13_53_10]
MVLVAVNFLSMFFALAAAAQEKSETDTIKTSAGDLKITFLGHGSLYFTFGGKVIHVDPYSAVADYSKLPKADIILLAHEHQDHLDLKALNLVRTDKTIVVLPQVCAKQVEGGVVLDNGATTVLGGVRIDAVAAYNIVNKRADSGQPYHPKGVGNGYILTFGDKRIYVAGDTENIPEIKAIKNIEVAFLPMNLPYTMTPEMVADAAKTIKPKILYPYHFGETDTSKLVALLKDTKEIEVRIRKMK